MKNQQTDQLNVLHATHKYLEEELLRRNNHFGLLDMELQQLRSENERLLKAKQAEDANKKLLSSNDIILLTRELNNCKDQLAMERQKHSDS